jgi:hypothetical protein
VINPSLQSEGLAAFRRAYRWLNLTFVQQGVWPLLIVVFGAPAMPIGLTETPWYWVRLGAPLLAALLAVAYLQQRRDDRTCDPAFGRLDTAGDRDHRLREQMATLIVGVTLAVAFVRLVQGPLVPVLKVLAFGVANVAAYQCINFGLAGRISGSGSGGPLPVALFGLSWGLHDLFTAAASPVSGNLVLIFASGGLLGLAVGTVSWVLRQWPGGYLPASAFHLLVIYLVFGFVE